MSRPLALAVWSVCAALLLACEALARMSGGRYAGLVRLLGLLSASTPRRLALLLGWMWLGWHLFDR